MATLKSRVLVLFHRQLGSTLPRPFRRELCASLRFIRPKTTQSASRGSKNEALSSKPKDGVNNGSRSSLFSSPVYAKTTIRKGPPEKILIYHGGTGRTIFLGMLRITTIFLFGVSCLVVAPAFVSSDYPSYLAPAIIIGGALPMLFVSYTSAPFVNFIHLSLPVTARRSREQAIEYAKNLPQKAVLYINTMKFTTIPRQTQVQFKHLTPDKSLIRPVSFRNQKPAPLPWWRGKPLCQFYTAEKSKPGRESTTFYPELWEHVHKQIQNNYRSSRTKD